MKVLLPVQRIAVARLSIRVERHAIPAVRHRQVVVEVGKDGVEKFGLGKLERSVVQGRPV